MSTIDISHIRGDSFSRKFFIDNSTTAAFDEVWFTVRTSEPAASVVDDTAALSSSTLTNGDILATGNKEWTVSIDAPPWTVGTLYYDVQARTTSGQIFTLIKGKLRVYNDITRST